ncbi:MAG TPA: tetratricopeptide repeat protein [candidate division Zixibacteria bacterium]|nr:tetratricopeptide repeat protein [candidate division Zixibacteria bacterium]
MNEPSWKRLPEGFPVPRQATEKLLIERLLSSKTEAEYFRWLLFVASFYRGIEKPACARALLQLFLETSSDPSQKVHCHLALGQIAVDEQALELALNHFLTALGMDPKEKRALYVLHNNAGYCFNRLGRFLDAERHCRLAVGIDGGRASAYRNLGLSLRGQGNLTAAAWALAEAVRADPGDGRARRLLAGLAAGAPALALQCPWIERALCDPRYPTDPIPLI